MRAVETLALQILDAGGTIVGIEQHARRQRVQLDLQPIRMARRDVEQTLARAHPLVPIGAERRVAEAIGVAAAATRQSFGSPVATAAASAARSQRASAIRAAPRSRDCMSVASSRSSSQHLQRHRASRSAASRPSHARSDRGRAAQGAPDRPVAAVLQPLEVAPHVGRAPGRIAGQRRDVVPVRSRAAPSGSSRCARCSRRACRRADSSMPCPACSLAVARAAVPRRRSGGTKKSQRSAGFSRGERMEGRHVVVLGQPGAPSARIAARLQHHDAHAGFGQPRRQRAAAGAGADDDVVAVHRPLPSRCGSERLQELDQRALVARRSSAGFCLARTGRCRNSGRD